MIIMGIIAQQQLTNRSRTGEIINFQTILKPIFGKKNKHDEVATHATYYS